jgi:hypothetical protein
MTTGSIGSITSAVTGGLNKTGASGTTSSLFGGVVAQLESGSGETTTTTADGGSVTTIKAPDGKDQIVSETSASGTTLTQVGYVSPVLLQKFLDSLFTALQADGLGSATSSSAAGTGESVAAGESATAARAGIPGDSAGAAGTTGSGPLDASLQALMTQLGPNAALSSTTSSLLRSFDTLMQNSGIAIDSAAGETSSQASEAALQSFLSNAMTTGSDAAKAPGSTVDATA